MCALSGQLPRLAESDAGRCLPGAALPAVGPALLRFVRAGVLPALGQREQALGGRPELLAAADRHAEQERGDRRSWPVHLVRDLPGEIENSAFIHDRLLHAKLGARSADPRLQRAHWLLPFGRRVFLRGQRKRCGHVFPRVEVQPGRWLAGDGAGRYLGRPQRPEQAA
jgi:hypothetical protein